MKGKKLKQKSQKEKKQPKKQLLLIKELRKKLHQLKVLWLLILLMNLKLSLFQLMDVWT
jgi:hypothetical protein